MTVATPARTSPRGIFVSYPIVVTR